MTILITRKSQKTLQKKTFFFLSMNKQFGDLLLLKPFKKFSLGCCASVSTHRIHTKLHSHQVAVPHYALTAAPLWKRTQRSFISCNVKGSLQYKLIIIFRQKQPSHWSPPTSPPPAKPFDTCCGSCTMKREKQWVTVGWNCLKKQELNRNGRSLLDYCSVGVGFI